MSERTESVPGCDAATLERLGRVLGTTSAAETVRSAVEFTLQVVELARATRVGGRNPAQLDLLNGGAGITGPERVADPGA
jgi:hypothetical protein